MQIKEKDEWKAAFMTPKRLFRDLINMGKVAAFIDDVIVGIEDKEGHDELVVEIIKRLEENDLYVKLEKYK